MLDAIEGADLVIDAGGVNFNEINTGAYTSQLSPEKLVTIDIDHVRIGDRIFNPVQMGDLFEMLVKSVPKKFGYSTPRRQLHAKPATSRATRSPRQLCIPATETFSSQRI